MDGFSAEELFGRTALDRSGETLGTVEGVYLDRTTKQPEWAAIKTGRAENSLVPLAGAILDEAGVRLAVDEELVRGAPHGGEGRVCEEISAAQEAELYHYYALDYAKAQGDRLPSGPAAAG